MKKHGLIVNEGVLDSREWLYKFRDLSRPDSRLTALIAQVDKRSRIWHGWLTHFNFCNLNLMVTQNMVASLPKVLPLDGVCKGFVLGKHHHAPFNSMKAWRAQKPLELVHSDLCCINNPSLVGARYILTLINDLSRFTWVYFLNNKSHIFEKFKEFRALTEKKYGRPIKCLRSNNGGKYVS